VFQTAYRKQGALQAAMFASLPFSVVLNRGLEPYGDDEELYVGVIIEPGRNGLLIRISLRKENTLPTETLHPESISAGHKKGSSRNPGRNTDNEISVGAAEGCDLLIFSYLQIAKSRSKDRSLRQLLQGNTCTTKQLSVFPGMA
jgi:hypothetical protein